MSAGVQLHGISKFFGPVRAVDGISLDIQPGEFLTLLGPSGCGKTTLLRLIAGFDAPDSGAVLIGGEDVTHLPPHRRNVNQVFQSYALFPHLTVRENVAFGLRMQRRSAKELARRASEVIELVSLTGCEDRKPHQLSGGQQQRVALARALAPEPAVLLLDEPLSALDARLREAMQIELKRLQRQVGTTFIFVTHDQEEALTISDRIALIRGGRLEQCGDVEEIYHRPATAFAAQFIGQSNLLEAERLRSEGDGLFCRVTGGLELRLVAGRWPRDAKRALLLIRPEKIRVESAPAPGEMNGFSGNVREAVFRGPFARVTIATDSGTQLDALVAGESAQRVPFRAGDRVFGAIRSEDITVLTGSGVR